MATVARACLRMCVYVCVCSRARVLARVGVCVCVCVCVCVQGRQGHRCTSLCARVRGEREREGEPVCV